MSMKRHTQGSSEDFEDKIDAAMADLEIDPDDEFHNADFYEEEEPAETSDREEKTDPGNLIPGRKEKKTGSIQTNIYRRKKNSRRNIQRKRSTTRKNITRMRRNIQSRN